METHPADMIPPPPPDSPPPSKLRKLNGKLQARRRECTFFLQRWYRDLVEVTCCFTSHIGGGNSPQHVSQCDGLYPSSYVLTTTTRNLRSSFVLVLVAAYPCGPYLIRLHTFADGGPYALGVSADAPAPTGKISGLLATNFCASDRKKPKPAHCVQKLNCLQPSGIRPTHCSLDRQL
jgi:hypothetical protein